MQKIWFWLQVYLVFHLAGGLPLCYRAFRGERLSWRNARRWLFGLVLWPIPTGMALYETIRDEFKSPAK